MVPPAVRAVPLDLSRGGSDGARMKRGDGGGAGTMTAWPTMPPASTQHHGRPIPKIAGSEGGFIGLVTGLGILIIACSIGVWWLLKRRDQNGGRPFPLLSQLKSKAFKRDGRSSSGGGAYGNVGNKPKRSAKSGWVRTPDERDDHSSDDEQGGVKLGTGSKIRSRSRSPNPEGVYLNDSNPFGNPSTPAFGGPYNDAFTTRPSTDSLDEAVMAGVHRGHRDSINSDPKSPISPTSFEGGTKFKEGF